MHSIVKNERLYSAIKAYARRNKIEYTEAVKLLAERVGYKSHRKIYDLVRRAASASGARMFAIGKELRKSVDYLFGEG
jgi:hypothetical protein